MAHRAEYTSGHRLHIMPKPPIVFPHRQTPGAAATCGDSVGGRSTKENSLKRLTALAVVPVLAWGASLMTSAFFTSGVNAQTALAQTNGAAPAQGTYTQEQIDRGRYLVEGAAMCGQCHSPRNDKGELQMDQWLHGGPVPLLTPKGYAKKWAYKAPRLAGLPQHTDEQLVTLLTTGVNRDGREPMPPMPPYRMTADDARAIAAYLRSVP